MDVERSQENSNPGKGNISLFLNSYNALFSDFDPRDYSEKILSEDFLEECKRAARESDGKIELILLCPKDKRNLKDEAKIKKRIKEFFLYNFKKEHSLRKKLRFEGLVWFLIGSVVMVLATLLAGKTNFILKFLEIMAIPAWWFLFWEGLDKVFVLPREVLANYEFYKKMSNVNVVFADYW